MAWRGQVKWAVCSYEGRAEAWADTQRRSESQLVLVVNASVEGQPIGAHQRRAKWHHRARLVEAVWQLHGTEAYDFFWFLDETRIITRDRGIALHNCKMPSTYV